MPLQSRPSVHFLHIICQIIHFRRWNLVSHGDRGGKSFLIYRQQINTHNMPKIHLLPFPLPNDRWIPIETQYFLMCLEYYCMPIKRLSLLFSLALWLINHEIWPDPAGCTPQEQDHWQYFCHLPSQFFTIALFGNIVGKSWNFVRSCRLYSPAGTRSSTILLPPFIAIFPFCPGR